MREYFAIEGKKVDRRVIKTKRAIKTAFAELISKKDINLITIKDIADTADVNRKTVYNYYGGIHDILNEVEDDIVSAFQNVLKDIDFNRELKDPIKLLKALTDVITDNVEFADRLMKMETNTQLVRKTVTALVNMATEELKKYNIIREDKLNFVVNFMASGMLVSYQIWFNSDRKQPIEEFSKDIADLALKGASCYFNDKTFI